MLQLALVLALAFALGITVFAVQNTTLVPINFFGLQFDQVAVSLLLVLAALLGAALTFVLGLFREIGHRAQLHSLRDRVHMLERRSQELEGQLNESVPPSGGATAEQSETAIRPDR